MFRASVARVSGPWGRPHPVYIFGGLLLVQQLSVIPIGQSETWMSVARWVQHLAP